MPRNRLDTLLRRSGIRAHVTVAASAIVAVTLVVSAVVLVLLVQNSLIASLDATAMARARDIQSLSAAGTLQPIITSTGEETSLLQIVDASNRVIAATGNVQGQDAVLPVPPPKRVSIVRTTDRLAIGSGEFRVLALPVNIGSEKGWVYAATSLSQVHAAAASLTALFVVAVPLILVIVALTVWGAVGRVLRPVEEIRRRATLIGGADLTQRVPVPESADEIAGLAATMNEMLQRLESAADRQGRFVGDASHELRSPLAALRAQVDVALAHPEESNSRLVLENVQDQVNRMSTLIDDLLFLAHRAENIPASLDGVVDLDELVLAEVRRLRGLGGPEVKLAGIQAARIHGSQRDMTRMLRNLGDNAREHAGSRITVRLSVVRDMAELRVADDGPGIPAAERERVFERFTRLDNSRRRSTAGGGAGLGLSIAQQIVLDHHGSIAALPRTDGTHGAAFLVTVPLA